MVLLRPLDRLVRTGACFPNAMNLAHRGCAFLNLHLEGEDWWFRI